MLQFKRFSFLVLVCLTIPGVMAQNVEPLVSDRPGAACGTFTLSAGQFQVEGGVGVDFASIDGSTDFFSGTPAVLRIGLVENFEFRVATAGWSHASVGGQTLDGIGAPTVGFKYRAREAEGTDNGPSMAFIFNLELPAGSGDFRPPEPVPSLVFSMDQSLSANWSVNTNLGLSVPEDGSGERYNEAFYAVAFGRSLTDRTGLFLEFAGTTPSLSGLETQTFFDGGLSWLWTPDVQFDIALARRISGDGADWSVAGGIVSRLN